jgi:hypothetical protein
LNCERVVEAHGKWFFHHHVNAVTSAGFHDPAVIESICIHKDCLRVSLRDHVFQFSEELRLIKSVSRRRAIEELLVRFGDADDLDLRTVPRLLHEAVYMAVNQTDDADAQSTTRRRRLGE